MKEVGEAKRGKSTYLKLGSYKGETRRGKIKWKQSLEGVCVCKGGHQPPERGQG